MLNRYKEILLWFFAHMFILIVTTRTRTLYAMQDSSIQCTQRTSFGTTAKQHRIAIYKQQVYHNAEWTNQTPCKNDHLYRPTTRMITCMSHTCDCDFQQWSYSTCSLYSVTLLGIIVQRLYSGTGRRVYSFARQSHFSRHRISPKILDGNILSDWKSKRTWMTDLE